MSYDVENRLAQATNSANQTEYYSYAPNGQRVRKSTVVNSVQGPKYYFWGVDGKLIGQYEFGLAGYDYVFQQDWTCVYLGGRMVAKGGATITQDRLGTANPDSTTTPPYKPYGESGQYPSEGFGFTGYYRDQNTTGLDYAQQRYYAPGIGRFTSTDPYGANWDPANPQSWNLYSYVNGDPINSVDPTGEMTCGDSPYTYPDGFMSGTLRDALNTNTELGLFAAVVWAESSNDPQNVLDKLAVAYSITNRYLIVNNFIQVWIDSERTTDGIEWIKGSGLGWGQANRSLKSILGASEQYVTVVGGEANPRLRSDLRAGLDAVLRSDSMSDGCWNLSRAASAAITALQEPWGGPFLDLVTSFSHSQGKSSLIGEVFLGSAGSANRYFGLKSHYQLNPTQAPLPQNHWKPVDRRPVRPRVPWPPGGGRPGR